MRSRLFHLIFVLCVMMSESTLIEESLFDDSGSWGFIELPFDELTLPSNDVASVSGSASFWDESWSGFDPAPFSDETASGVGPLPHWSETSPILDSSSFTDETVSIFDSSSFLIEPAPVVDSSSLADEPLVFGVASLWDETVPVYETASAFDSPSLWDENASVFDPAALPYDIASTCDPATLSDETRSFLKSVSFDEEPALSVPDASGFCPVQDSETPPAQDSETPLPTDSVAATRYKKMLERYPHLRKMVEKAPEETNNFCLVLSRGVLPYGVCPTTFAEYTIPDGRVYIPPLGTYDAWRLTHVTFGLLIEINCGSSVDLITAD